MSKKYFEDVKIDDEVFGLVFGKGKVRNILNGFYHFEVIYKNNQVVPYTLEGVSGWSNQLDFQTVFFKEDIDLMDEQYDFSLIKKELSAKKIIKLRLKNKLEVRCESGLWRKVSECPSFLIERYLEDNKLFLFRKIK